MARTGRPGLNLTPERIKWAIKSTQSMKQAADYLNTSLNTVLTLVPLNTGEVWSSLWVTII